MGPLAHARGSEAQCAGTELRPQGAGCGLIANSTTSGVRRLEPSRLIKSAPRRRSVGEIPRLVFSLRAWLVSIEASGSSGLHSTHEETSLVSLYDYVVFCRLPRPSRYAGGDIGADCR